MKKHLELFLADESGQGFTEYALILALVGIGLIAILITLRNQIGDVFNEVANELNNAPASDYGSGSVGS